MSSTLLFRRRSLIVYGFTPIIDFDSVKKVLANRQNKHFLVKVVKSLACVMRQIIHLDDRDFVI